VVFSLLVGGMIFLFAALRIIAQTPEAAHYADAPVVEATAPVVEVVGVIAPGPAAASAPSGVVASQTIQGSVRFSARQLDPSYTVVSGDSLSSIAQRHGTTAEVLQGLNNLPDTFLSVGQRLVIP